MKKLAALVLLSFCMLQARAQGNALHKSFGTGGKVATSMNAYGDEEAVSVVCQRDGKIIAGGSSAAGRSSSASMIRYLANGTIDAAFGNNGRILLNVANDANTSGAGAVIQTVSGVEYILLAGTYYDIGANRFSVQIGRYHMDGTVDRSFGTGGIVALPGAYARKIIVDTSGCILLPGLNDAMADRSVWGLIRLRPDGGRDSTFGDMGYATRPDTTFGSPSAVALQPDGKIVIAGTVYGLSDFNKSDMGAVRYEPDGSIDSSFGTGGLVRISPDTSAAEVYGMTLQPDGKILICGLSDSAYGKHFYLTRLLPDGTADAAFGTAGAVRTRFGNGQSWANAVVHQRDGKIYVAGYTAPEGATPPYLFAIARYNPDGVPDSTFGVAGRDTSAIGDVSGAMDAAITPSGSVVAAGWSYWAQPIGRFRDMALMEYITGLELGVLSPGANPRAMVYPNPVRSSLHLSYELAAADRLTIQLTDLTGRRVQVFRAGEPRAAGTHRDVLTIGDWVVPGQYLLQVASTTGITGIRLQVVK